MHTVVRVNSSRDSPERHIPRLRVAHLHSAPVDCTVDVLRSSQWGGGLQQMNHPIIPGAPLKGVENDITAGRIVVGQPRAQTGHRIPY